MPYTLEFPINAGNPAPLRDIAAAVDQISQRTKLSTGELKIFDAAMQASLKSGISLKQALLDLTAATPTLSKGINNLAKELLTLDSQAVKVGNTLQSHTVPQVAAASAALRGLEGGMNLRAAERFLSTITGVGSALQAAFPIFGAVALLEITGRMVEEVGKLYNAWDPVQHAQQRSLQILKESLPELKKLTAESGRLTEQARQREFGAGYTQRMRAQSSEHDAASDQRMIDLLRGQVDAAEARVRAGTIAATGPTISVGKGGAEFSKPGTSGGLTTDALAAQEQLVGLNAKLEDAILQKRVDQLKSEDAKAELNKDSLQKALERQRKIEEIDRKTAQIKERSLALQDTAELGGFGKVGKLEEDRRAMERRYAKEEADLEDQRRQNRLGGPDQVRVPNSVFDAQGAAIQAARTLDRASINRQIIAEARTEGDNQHILREEFANVSRESSGKRARELFDLTFKDMFKEMPAQFAADEQIENIQTGAKREGIIRQAGRSQRIAQLSGGDVRTGYQAQLQLAKQLQDLDLETALKVYSSTGDVNKLRVDGARADADISKATAEARLEAEVKILELRQKQKTEYEDIAKGALAAFVQGKSRGLDEFIKQKVVGVGSTVVGNITGAVYDKIGGGQLEVPGQGTSQAPNILGKILKGTAFGLDPLKDAKEQNSYLTLTSSNDRLKLSIDSLKDKIEYIVTNGASGSMPGGLGPATPGFPGFGGLSPIGGLSTFGSDVTGLTGAATGVLSSTGSTTAMAASSIAAVSALAKSGTFLDNLGFPGRNGAPGYTAASLVAPGVEIGAGALGLISGVGQGGVKGALTAGGGAAGVVAGVSSALKAMGLLSAGLSAIPIVGGILGAALPLIGSLFGSNPQIRQNQINKIAENQQFYSPETISSMQDVGGNLSTYSRTGQVRSSAGISPYPAGIQEPFYLYPTHPILGTGTPGVNVPGTGGTFGAPIGTGVGNVNPAGGTTIIIHAIDSKSLADTLSDNHQAVGDAMTRNLHSGGSAHLEAMRAALGMG